MNSGFYLRNYPLELIRKLGQVGIYGTFSIDFIMAKYDGLLGQIILEVEEPDKEEGITFIFQRQQVFIHKSRRWKD